MAGKQQISQLLQFPRRYLRQTPLEKILRKFRKSESILHSFFKGKHVAIIGNAKSQFDKQNGKRIDGADIIIRMNRGFIQNQQSQGSRTDLLVLGTKMTDSVIIKEFDPSLILWMPQKSKRFEIWSFALLRKTVFFPRKYKQDDISRLGNRGPSTGFMVIRLLLRDADVETISLYGFDFGKTDTFYNPAGYVSPHPYDKEHAIILEAEENGLLTIN